LDAGRYRFRLYADDGVRLWVDDALVVEAWQDPQSAWHEAEVELGSGYHFILLEYYEAAGPAAVRLVVLQPVVFLPRVVKRQVGCGMIR
jgi:hypothetical protein